MSADGMTLSHAAVTISRFRGESFLLTTNQIRQQFLEYFEKNQHRRVSSSALVPAGDPTWLFTFVGMNQFQGLFLGGDLRDSKPAQTALIDVGAAGKHTDLQNA